MRNDKVEIVGTLSSSQDSVVVIGGGVRSLSHGRTWQLPKSPYCYRELNLIILRLKDVAIPSIQGMRMPQSAITLGVSIAKPVSCISMSRGFNAPDGVARTIKCSYDRSGWGFWDIYGLTPSAASSAIVIYEK